MRGRPASGGRGRGGGGPQSYSTAFSHLVLAGTGAFYFMNINGDCSCSLTYHLSRCSFAIIIVNSVIGVWRHGNPSYGNQASGLYSFTSMTQDVLTFPCILATMLYKYNYSQDIVFGSFCLPAIPFLGYLMGSHVIKTESEKIMAVMDSLAIAYMSYMYVNYYGFAMNMSYLFNILFVKDNANNSLKMPAQDLYNYAMCFFSYFALQTITD